MTVTIENTYTGDGSTADYSFTFPYLDTSDIKVTLATVATTAYSLLNATTVRFDSAPGNGVAIRIYRETAFDTPKATFYPGSAIRANDLNDNTLQNLYVNQESNDKVADAWLSGDPTVISTETWYTTDDTKVATTKAIEGRIDAKIDTALTTDVAGGNKITVTDNSPGSGQITVGVTSGSLVNSDVNTSAAIAGTKIAPNFGSQNIVTSGTAATGAVTVTGNIAVSGTVDGRDVAADGTKLDGIESAATADQSNAEIRAAVEAASDSNVFTDADHTKLNAIEASATADQTAAEIRTLVESASDSNVFTDADHTKLNAIEASATADQTASEIKSLIASSPLDASHLATDSVTTDEIADAELTTLAGMQSGTASILASSTALTSTTTELNQLDGKTLGETTLTTNSNTAIPTSKAVNDRILTVTNALGGFVAIADKDNFPTSNPDPSGDAGTVVSISNAAGISVNSSGVGSLATRAGGSDAVIINGFPSALRGGATVGSATNANPYILPSSVGLQVQTTSTDHTYDYHKYLINEEDANKLSGDIQDFQERYRVASSAPSSSLDDGDLWFDTANDKMKVYNATSSSWDDVATVGDFFINTLSSSSNTGGGSATFNGTAYRFVLSSPPTSAQQLIVSVNGVIQKPNAGSSQPSEGFAVSGNDIIFSAAPPSGADYFITTQGSAVSIGTPSDNTISTAKLQNLAVTGDKVATNLDLADNKKIRFGTGNDLQLYHDGADSWIKNSHTNLIVNSANFYVNNAGQTEYMISAHENAAAKLYYDGSAKLETLTNGIKVTGRVQVSDFIETFTNDTDLKINSAGSSGQIKFYINGSEKAKFDSSGNFSINNDSGKITLGTGSDLKIYSDGTHGFITNHVGGAIYLRANSNIQLSTNASDGGADDALKCINNGAVELYYDNSKKIATTANGVQVDNGKIEIFQENNPAVLQLHREDASIVADDVIGRVNFTGRDSGGVGTERLGAVIRSVAAATWDTGQTSGYSASHLDFHTQGNVGDDTITAGPRMRIDSSGRISAGGCTNAGTAFSGGDDLVIGNGTNGTRSGITLISAANTDGGVYFGDDASTVTGQLVYNHSTDNFTIYTSSIPRARFDSDGLKFNNDTAAANALDDYEEGDFTPVITGGTHSVHGAYGRYVRVGKLVTISVRLQISVSAVSGGVTVTGLPFTPITGTGANYTSGGITYYDMPSSVTNFDPYITSGTAIVYFFEKGTGTQLTFSSTFTSKYLGFSAMYYV